MKMRATLERFQTSKLLPLKERLSHYHYAVDVSALGVMTTFTSSCARDASVGWLKSDCVASLKILTVLLTLLRLGGQALVCKLGYWNLSGSKDNFRWSQPLLTILETLIVTLSPLHTHSHTHAWAHTHTHTHIHTPHTHTHTLVRVHARTHAHTHTRTHTHTHTGNKTERW